MKLNKDKIKKLKAESGLTWADIARIGELPRRQDAHQKIKSVKNSGFFAKVFNVDEKELIIFD